MRALIERLESWFTAGEIEQAEALVRSLETTNPACYELGLAAMAAVHQDADAATLHADRAAGLAPADPTVHQYLAMAALLRGDRASAAHHAAAVVARGGDLHSLRWLGKLQLGNGDARGAEQTFRFVLALVPGVPDALNGLGVARFQQRDFDEAVTSFARAFGEDPTDPTAIRNLLGAYREAGQMLGAIALATRTRSRYPEPDAQVAIDIVLLQANAALLEGLPPPGVANQADEAVQALVRDAARSPVRIRLGAARALLDCRRFDEAQQLMQDLQPEITESTDRANAAYIHGVLAAQAGDFATALAAYEVSVATDPARWDACCNAVTLLLQRNDPASLARVGELLARVPEPLKRSRPQLMFNEAVYLRRSSRIADARAAAQAVLAAAHGTELATLAQGLLDALSDEM